MPLARSNYVVLPRFTGNGIHLHKAMLDHQGRPINYHRKRDYAGHMRHFPINHSGHIVQTTSQASRKDSTQGGGKVDVMDELEKALSNWNTGSKRMKSHR